MLINAIAVHSCYHFTSSDTFNVGGWRPESCSTTSKIRGRVAATVQRLACQDNGRLSLQRTHKCVNPAGSPWSNCYPKRPFVFLDPGGIPQTAIDRAMLLKSQDGSSTSTVRPPKSSLLHLGVHQGLLWNSICRAIDWLVKEYVNRIGRVSNANMDGSLCSALLIC